MARGKKRTVRGQVRRKSLPGEQLQAAAERAQRVMRERHERSLDESKRRMSATYAIAEAKEEQLALHVSQKAALLPAYEARRQEQLYQHDVIALPPAAEDPLHSVQWHLLDQKPRAGKEQEDVLQTLLLHEGNADKAESKLMTQEVPRAQDILAKQVLLENKKDLESKPMLPEIKAAEQPPRSTIRRGSPAPPLLVAKFSKEALRETGRDKTIQISSVRKPVAIHGSAKSSGIAAAVEELANVLQDSTDTILEPKNREAAASSERLSAVVGSDWSPQRSWDKGGRRTDWQAVVHQYVRLCNQAETEQHIGEVASYIADEEHANRLQQRLLRARNRDLLRGAIPLNGETQAEILRVHESPSEIHVLLQLHNRRNVHQDNGYYIEERFEQERIWLTKIENSKPARTGWQIARIEPVIVERRPRFGMSAMQAIPQNIREEDSTSSHVGTLPYINSELIPSLHELRYMKPGSYRRDLAAAYADRWWDKPNPAYEEFAVNCTNYVSQCIVAGQVPMNYTGKRESGWWYKERLHGQENWSYSWAVSHALALYLSAFREKGLRAIQVESAAELKLGDVIAYDWSGDSRFQHTTIVTAFDADGEPLVNANTVPSRHRYWDYSDSYAWTDRTRYLFFHIEDEIY